MTTLTRSVLFVAAVVLFAGCDSRTTTPPAADFQVSYEPEFVPASLRTAITNPFYALAPGTTYRYEKRSGAETEVVLFEVTSETRTIAGVTTRVVRDRVTHNGVLIEDTLDWFAQSAAGDV